MSANRGLTKKIKGVWWSAGGQGAPFFDWRGDGTGLVANVSYIARAAGFAVAVRPLADGVVRVFVLCRVSDLSIAADKERAASCNGSICDRELAK